MVTSKTAQREETGQASGEQPWSFDERLPLLLELRETLSRIRDEMTATEAEMEPRLRAVHPLYRDSSRNLIHYLALRRHDLRRLQEQLGDLGLSSLGRSESHTLGNLNAVLKALERLAGQAPSASPAHNGALSLADARALLDAHTSTLLGPGRAERGVRIMVTLPAEAATSYEFVRNLLEQGMDCARINCAYDGPEVWDRMISHVRRAQGELERSCRVAMDLAGPKLRTGIIGPGPQVITWRPTRDVRGAITAPARIWLTPLEAQEPAPRSADAWLPVAADWLSMLEPGDKIRFRDLRSKQRSMDVVARAGGSWWATAESRAYVGPGARLRAARRVRGRRDKLLAETSLGDLPAREQAIELREGDALVLTRDPLPGSPTSYDGAGNLVRDARIGCTLPEVFDQVRPGERVLFDDGKIGGVVTSVSVDEIRLKITRAAPTGSKLRADKGINFPDTTLEVSCLTEKDRTDLRFVAQHADMVQLSFVDDPQAISEVQDYLAEHSGRPVGLVLKIETPRSLERLPALILAAMRSYPAGVMIARGDLAVECGYERMAEAQEEVLWLCEAAHVPVIWATQVLESMTKTGLPSRAEITDAAMGGRAECVMLSKGPHILAAVGVLDNILQRMQTHQQKKGSLLRQLHVATRL